MSYRISPYSTFVVTSSVTLFRIYLPDRCNCDDSSASAMPTLDDDSGSDRDDELPQVVVLKSGDLTADEVEKTKENPVTGTEKGKAKIMLDRWLSYII